MRTRTMRSITVGSVALAALLALGGCSLTVNSSDHGDMGSDHGDMSQMMSTSPEASASAADIMFAQMMIPHHQQAVEMSTLAETRASDPQIKQLAAQIKAAQQPEIDQMKAWLEEWGMPVMDSDEAMGSHMGHGMSGMLTDEQMSELEAASGTEFDILYAQYMIEHHKGAIEMAQDVADSKDSRVAALAAAIIETQQAEIAEMEAMLQSLQTQPSS